MTEYRLRVYRESDEELKRARAFRAVKALSCGRCEHKLWFWALEGDPNTAAATEDFERSTGREGCPWCDPDGHAIQKEHFTLMLSASGGWPPGVIPSASELQEGLTSALGGVIRADPSQDRGADPAASRHYELRAEPKAGGPEEILRAVVSTLERLQRMGRSGPEVEGPEDFKHSLGRPVTVALKAEAGNLLCSTEATIGSGRCWL